MARARTVVQMRSHASPAPDGDAIVLVGVSKVFQTRQGELQALEAVPRSGGRPLRGAHDQTCGSIISPLAVAFDQTGSDSALISEQASYAVDRQ